MAQCLGKTGTLPQNNQQKYLTCRTAQCFYEKKTSFNAVHSLISGTCQL